MKTLMLKPIVSEKALALAEGERTYLFEVPRASSKAAIAQAIKERFKVKVVAVNTTLAKGKAKSTPVQRGVRRVSGWRSDAKKAYVRLAEGQTIKLFEEAK